MFKEKTQEFHSKQGIEGLCYIRLIRPDGEVKEERVIHNTVTELQDAHIADQLSDAPGEAQIGYIAVGTGTGQTSASTGLATSLDRNALTSTTQGAGAADNDLIYVGDWAAGDGTGAITEAGILTADDNISMQFYASFSVINKGAADTLQITWTATYGAS